MWLVEDWGVDRFRDTIAEYMGTTLAKGKHMEVSSYYPIVLDVYMWRLPQAECLLSPMVGQPSHTVHPSHELIVVLMGCKGCWVATDGGCCSCCQQQCMIVADCSASLLCVTTPDQLLTPACSTLTPGSAAAC